MRYFTLLAALVSWVTVGTKLYAQQCSLFPPENIHVSQITSCSATLQWTSGVQAIFTVAYKLSTSSQWSSSIKIGNDTSYRFTGLESETKYDFLLTAKCQDGSFYKKKATATTLPCAPPGKITLDKLNSHSIGVRVKDSCDYDSLYIRYSTVNGPEYLLSFPASGFYLVSELKYDSAYLFEFSICPPYENQWTDPFKIQLNPPPNIVLILIDDSRYDYFSCNGAPSFFQTPNIDRIADEGVNFKKSFVVTSLCAPSRATIATGLFTLKTGIHYNEQKLDPKFITIPEVLGDHGYYTALIGKNHHTFLNGPDSEFDFYMQSRSFEANMGKKFNYNGDEIIIDKEYILTVTDTALALIGRTEQPLFLWLAYQLPHFPNWPLESKIGKYDDYEIPWPADTARYEVNYPSFLYDNGLGDLLYGYDLDTTYRNILEVIDGLDSCVGEIIHALEVQNELDNTLLIFMSDNGYMLGNHWLNNKTFAYEPSMRIPLFIRYPEWFTPSSEIIEQFATNLDIAATMYEAAQIDYDANYDQPMDGFSLKKLYDGEVERTSFYYIKKHKASAGSPTVKSVRDRHFKYIFHTCEPDIVEEFFDMENDPLELNNLINNSAYDSIIQVYRLKYDSMKVIWSDNVTGPEKECFLEDVFYERFLSEAEDDTEINVWISPTLTDGAIQIYTASPMVQALLYNGFGQLVQSWTISQPLTTVNLSEMADGIYFINVRSGDESITEKIVKTGNR